MLCYSMLSRLTRYRCHCLIWTTIPSISICLPVYRCTTIRTPNKRPSLAPSPVILCSQLLLTLSPQHPIASLHLLLSSLHSQQLQWRKLCLLKLLSIDTAMYCWVEAMPLLHSNNHSNRRSPEQMIAKGPIKMRGVVGGVMASCKSIRSSLHSLVSLLRAALMLLPTD